jgi:hypothetical protein
MSRGPGLIERRIADLFAATRDRTLSIDAITDNAYRLGGARPTREQRLSATRAAHRVLRRVREMDKRAQDLRCKDRDSPEAKALSKEVYRIGVWPRRMRDNQHDTIKVDRDYWCTSTIRGRLFFHPPDVPVRVWAVSIQPAGVIWAEATVTKVTERNVMVRYAGETARLDRATLWHWWAFWRGVRFVSSRTGRIAAELDAIWWEKYGQAGGGVPPILQLPLAEAMALLGLPAGTDYTRDDVLAAFRRAAKKAHPDIGGTPEMFRKLVEARDRLLAALGTSAPAPKPPTYAPEGTRVVYRRSSVSRQRLGRTRLLGA